MEGRGAGQGIGGCVCVGVVGGNYVVVADSLDFLHAHVVMCLCVADGAVD
jgi:hypothetical protein